MFSALNGSDMTGILRTLDGLKPADLLELERQRGKYAFENNMPRIEFAMYVVEARQLPPTPPADLPQDQIREAREFLQRTQADASKEPSQDDLILDILQFALDLVGVVDPTGLADGASALISLSRGEWLNAAISAVSLVPYVGDMAKLGKLPKYARTVEKAVQVAGKDAKFADKMLPGMKKLRKALDKVPLDQLPTAVRDQMGRIRNLVIQFIKEARHLSWGEIISLARKNGSSAGQFAIERGGKRITANVDNVVELLKESREAGRHPAAKRNANALLEMMADSEWKVTAGPHPSTSDATKHITIRIEDFDKQFHVRLDNEGHLFEVRHPDGTNLVDIDPWAAPGAPSSGGRADGAR
jgi:hypothetical protein